MPLKTWRALVRARARENESEGEGKRGLENDWYLTRCLKLQFPGQATKNKVSELQVY